ncbi:MAG: aminoacyl-tRNA hydrolase [Peptoniphilaceae bacterium]|uniref:aminoacyl-tRNA hydrolase n=1 Tax=Parvimonas sp. TaxID=1944660 RepID=UPI0025DE79CE|nr:aminoacyl-tRNA hydrolase [Parvimonas sp.]MCI5996633.1 aminoacyl-tRNA hydrolase [Parvimonas sp.]MDD7765243.1 aminoacyl-tRNA hydrolase [Peptoniphilaceae bacterium]
MEDKFYLIVGLGNPGKNYVGTRHNVGYGVIDILAKRHDISMNREKFKSFYGQKNLFEKKCIFLKPLTYMNLSGEAVIDAAKYFNINPKNIIVIVDDIDIPFGTVKIKKKGSAGTHNGLKSIIYQLETEEFPRVKVSVGKCPSYMDLKDFVLSGFSANESKILNKELELSADAVEEILRADVDKAMCKFNGVVIEE